MPGEGVLIQDESGNLTPAALHDQQQNRNGKYGSGMDQGAGSMQLDPSIQVLPDPNLRDHVKTALSLNQGAQRQGNAALLDPRIPGSLVDPYDANGRRSNPGLLGNQSLLSASP